MHPITVKMVGSMDNTIRFYLRSRFIARCAIAVNFVCGITGFINCWALDSALAGVAGCCQFSCVVYVYITSRRSGRELKLLQQIRRDMLRMDAANTLAQAEVYSDQLDAAFALLEK